MDSRLVTVSTTAVFWCKKLRSTVSIFHSFLLRHLVITVVEKYTIGNKCLCKYEILFQNFSFRVDFPMIISHQCYSI